MKTYGHLLPNDDMLQEMLKKIGCSSVDELFSDVPPEVRETKPLRVPGPFTQYEIERAVRSRLSGDGSGQDNPCFLGGGIWPHYIPPAVRLITGRSEFYTSYTPYQPEISQGMLQALFEYQSLVCDLTGMDAANASMYDWPSAAAEACRMAVRSTSRNRVLMAENAGFERRRVIETFLGPERVQVESVGFSRETGLLDEGVLEESLGDDVAALYIEQPNFFGAIETSIRKFGNMVHSAGSKLVVGVEPTSLGLLTPPGEYGADIVVGEGQPLGIPMSYGGPSLGIFAARGDLQFLRQMPGRIIGMTTEKKGGDRRGYVMVLQTREQHIRREKATSNICTNQSLMAVAAAAYMALLGRDGFPALSRTITSNAHYVAKRISETKKYSAPAFDSEFYSDFVISHLGGKTGSGIYDALAQDKVYGAVPLSWYYGGMDERALISVTEAHTMGDVDRLIRSLEGVQ